MKFSVITVLSAALVSIVYGAALNPAQVNQLASRDDTAVKNYEDVVGYALPDGRRKIDFYMNGALEGSAVETSDGVEFFDAEGTAVDLDAIEMDFTKRQSRFQFAIKFAKLLARWGKRAWDFFYCIGLNLGWKCSDDFLRCATGGIAPWECIEGIVCVGAAATKCT